MMERKIGSAALSLAVGIFLAVPAAAEGPHRPIPATIGTAATPPNDLAIAAKVLRDAAAARNVDGVAAMIVERPTLISSGLTVDVPRRTEKRGPWRDARAGLAEIGASFREGDVVAPGTVDLSELDLDSLFEAIVTAIDEAEWGRDPLVDGAICTQGAARWKPATGDGVAGTRGWWVDAPTAVKASADPGAKTLATLKPGFLHLQGFVDDPVEGWAAVRLPSGATGVVEERALHPAVARAVCFGTVGPGDWRVVAFSAVGL